jgi:hypothetical protein
MYKISRKIKQSPLPSRKKNFVIFFSKLHARKTYIFTKILSAVRARNRTETSIWSSSVINQKIFNYQQIYVEKVWEKIFLKYCTYIEFFKYFACFFYTGSMKFLSVVQCRGKKCWWENKRNCWNILAKYWRWRQVLIMGHSLHLHPPILHTII